MIHGIKHRTREVVWYTVGKASHACMLYGGLAFCGQYLSQWAARRIYGGRRFNFRRHPKCKKCEGILKTWNSKTKSR